MLADGAEAPTLRGAAALWLAMRFPRDAAGLIARALADPSLALKLRLATALTLAPSREGVAALQPSLHDPRWPSRAAAALTLGTLGTPEGEACCPEPGGGSAGRRSRPSARAPGRDGPPARQPAGSRGRAGARPRAAALPGGRAAPAGRRADAPGRLDGGAREPGRGAPLRSAEPGRAAGARRARGPAGTDRLAVAARRVHPGFDARDGRGRPAGGAGRRRLGAVPGRRIARHEQEKKKQTPASPAPALHRKRT